MTVKIVKARPDARAIKGKWLRAQVRSLGAEIDLHVLSRLINIERQFGGEDIDYLLKLRTWVNEQQRSDTARVSDSGPETYDVE